MNAELRREIIEQMSHDEDSIALEVIKSLKQWDHASLESLEEEVCWVLEEQSPNRGVAVLTSLRKEQLSPRLIRAILSAGGRDSLSLRWKVMRTLDRLQIQTRKAALFLLDGLEHDSVSLRRAATQALVGMLDGDYHELALQGLLTMWDHGDYQSSMMAQAALREIPFRDAAQLRRWFDSSDEALQCRALRCVASIQKPDAQALSILADAFDAQSAVQKTLYEVLMSMLPRKRGRYSCLLPRLLDWIESGQEQKISRGLQLLSLVELSSAAMTMRILEVLCGVESEEQISRGLESLEASTCAGPFPDGKPEELCRALSPFLRSHRKEIKLKAVELLRAWDASCEDSAQLLLELLARGPTHAVAWPIIRCLRCLKLYSDELFERVSERLYTCWEYEWESAELYRESCEYLGQLGKGNPIASHALCRFLEAQPENSARRDAALALARLLPEAMPDFFALSLSWSPALRISVMRVLREAGQEALPYCIEMMQHPDGQVRSEAAWMIGKLRAAAPEACVAALLEALDDPDSWVRRLAAEALGECKDPAALEGLLRGLEDPEWDVRVAAIEAIVALDPEPSGAPVCSFEALLEDPSEEVRAAAIWALGHRFPQEPSVGEILLCALDDPSILVRAEAAFGIEHFLA